MPEMTLPNVAMLHAAPETDHSSALFRLREQWDDVAHSLLFLNRLHVLVRPGARILDFGCGAGKTVFKLREMGFDAYGFDIHDYVEYRSEEDRQWFRFSYSTSPAKSSFTVDADSYRVPFPDNFFDVVHSTSVLEHVLDAGLVLGEGARVLKPEGIAVHFYPGKFQLVEPHLYVPLASVVNFRAWLRLWITLGATNEYQVGRTVDEITDAYSEYVATGLRYRSRAELREAAAPHFQRIGFAPMNVIWPGSNLRDRITQFIRAFDGPNVYRQIALCGRLSALVCEKKVRHLGGKRRKLLWR